MRISRIALVAGVLLTAQLAGSGCILVPKLLDRSVTMVVAQLATVPLHATGATNTIGAGNAVDLRDSVDFARAVDDAGIDAADLEKLVVSKVEYRVRVADATPTRAITAANLQVTAGGGPLTSLVSGFSHPAGATTPWLSAPLTAAGVTQINNMLAAIVTELHGGPPADEHIGYILSGTSAPVSTPTDFWYEIRVTLQASGKIKTKILG